MMMDMENKTKKNKILVVDDEVKACGLMKKFLERRNYLVESANNGEEALHKIKEFEPEVILLDILMPGIRGDKIIKLIKKWKPELEVIVTTAVIEKGTHEFYKNEGAFSCVQKPLHYDSLIEELEVALVYRNQNLGQTSNPIATLNWNDIKAKISQLKEAIPA
jgi:DNA-binding NtrC family response regulator